MSRHDKIAEELKREVSRIVQEELRDPRLGFTTITRVEMTPDLRFARIFFSVYGQEKQWQETEACLEAASGFIRRLIGERLELRFVPEIVFKSDHSSEYSILIERQLEQLKAQQAEAKLRKKKNDSKKTARRIKKKKP